MRRQKGWALSNECQFQAQKWIILRARQLQDVIKSSRENAMPPSFIFLPLKMWHLTKRRSGINFLTSRKHSGKNVRSSRWFIGGAVVFISNFVHYISFCSLFTFPKFQQQKQRLHFNPRHTNLSFYLEQRFLSKNLYLVRDFDIHSFINYSQSDLRM